MTDSVSEERQDLSRSRSPVRSLFTYAFCMAVPVIILKAILEGGGFVYKLMALLLLAFGLLLGPAVLTNRQARGRAVNNDAGDERQDLLPFRFTIHSLLVFTFCVAAAIVVVKEAWESFGFLFRSPGSHAVVVSLALAPVSVGALIGLAVGRPFRQKTLGAFVGATLGTAFDALLIWYLMVSC